MGRNQSPRDPTPALEGLTLGTVRSNVPGLLAVVIDYFRLR